MVLTCVECYSVHFNVRWNDTEHIWQVVCEGCGTVYQLTPTGVCELWMRGIDQN